MLKNVRTLVDLQNHSFKLYKNRKLFGYNQNNQIIWKTYENWMYDSNRFSNFLLEHNVKEGDHIGIISNNCYEWACLAYGTYKIGAIYVPMYMNQSIDECNYITNNSNLKLLFCNNYNKYLESVNKINSNNLDNIYFLKKEKIKNYDYTNDHPNFINMNTLKFNYKINKIKINENNTANLIYTSGTTGNPKGVVITHKNIISNIKMIRESFTDFDKICNMNDKSVSFLPWAHCYGMTCELNGLISTGGSMYISESIEKLPDEIIKNKPTLIYSVPTLFTKIYKGVENKFNTPLKNKIFKDSIESYFKKDTLSIYKNKIYDKLIFSKVRDRLGGKVKHAFVGGASTPIEVLKFFEASKLPIIEGYGLSETSPIITLSNLEIRKLGSVGKPLPGYHIKIIKDEIFTSGDNVMKEYYLNNDENNKVFKYFDKKKYFKTGDNGYIDNDGYLYIKGRSKEEYKLENGKYVVPGKIEEKILLSKMIKQVILYGENKEYNIALVYPDYENIKTNREIKEQIKNLLLDEITLLLEKNNIKSYEIPKNILILENELTVENGFLTPKMSIKKQKVINHYIEQINYLYSIKID